MTKKRIRRTYTREFKVEPWRMVTANDYPLSQAA